MQSSQNTTLTGWTWVTITPPHSTAAIGWQGYETETSSKPRFGLQWRIGSSRVTLETRADTQEAADDLLRDQALGLAAKLEEWARDRDRAVKPRQTPEGNDPYLVGGEG